MRNITEIRYNRRVSMKDYITYIVVGLWVLGQILVIINDNRGKF